MTSQIEKLTQHLRDFWLGKRLALQQALFGHHLAFLVVFHLYLVKGNWSSHGLVNALHQPVDLLPLVYGQPAARWRGLLGIFKKCTNSQGVVVDCGDCLVSLEELNPSKKNTHTHTKKIIQSNTVLLIKAYETKEKERTLLTALFCHGLSGKWERTGRSHSWPRSSKMASPYWPLRHNIPSAYNLDWGAHRSSWIPR